jgi:opacity protein-like surface antigen
MKKILFLAAAAIMTANVASAQFTYGVKGGLNLANISNLEMDMKPSIYVGAFGEYQISDFFGVAGELVYSRQGAAASAEGVKTKTRLSYLNVPVLAKLYIADGLSLDLGPQFGFLTGAKQWVEAEGASGSVDIKDTVNGFDLSVGMGLSYNITENILVQGRYNLGLTDGFKNNESDDKFKNNVIQVGVGYRF